MKNFNQFLRIITVAMVIVFAMTGCGGEDEPEDKILSGNLTIKLSGNGPAVAGCSLQASYDGSESLSNASYQWNRNGSPLTDNQWWNMETDAGGNYTVTMSINGYEPKTSPAFIVLESGVNIVSLNGNKAVAIKTNGSLWAWSVYGGTSTESFPAQIGTDTDWKTVSKGSDHTVAIKENGSLWAWGTNGSNQVGDGTNTNRDTPVRIGTETDAGKIILLRR